MIEKTKQPDLFVVELADVSPRDDLASMEHPLFSLTPNPDGRELRYETEKDVMQINPSVKGLPTIFDKDILIFCISRLMDAKNRGEKISKKLKFSAHDLLLSTQRRTGGVEYNRLRDAFVRLQGTQFISNIKTGGEATETMFSIFSEAGFSFDTTSKKMRVKHCEVTLSDWVMRSIESNEVVQISPEYFGLRKPLERRLYEIARKHCGNQKTFSIGLKKLQVKTGSNTELKQFRRYVREAIERDNIPFYRFEIGERDIITIRPRTTQNELSYNITLPEWAEEKGREIATEKGWDYYALREKWLSFAKQEAAKNNPPENAGAAFVAYCNKQDKLR